MGKYKNSKFYIIIAAALGGLLIVVLAFAAKSWQSRGGKLDVIYIPKVQDNSDFWGSLALGAQAAAKEYDINLKIAGPSSEGDVEKQNEIIRQSIEERPDAIILSPCSYTESTEAAKQIVKAGIHLILVDSSMEEPLGETLVCTNNTEAGKKLGELLRKYLPEDPVIGIVSHVRESSTAMEREKGLREGLEGYEDRILPAVFCDSDYDKAYKVTQQLLEEHPEINAIAGLTEYSAVGAARAVKDMGLEDEIVMVGFDSSLEEIQLLEAGIFKGIVVQKPFNMGYLAVQKSVEVIYNTAVDPTVDSGSEEITKGNMYTEENQKLLFPFLAK